MVGGRRERGSALLLALVTVLVVTMGVLLVAGLIHQRTLVYGYESREVVTTALADAAMAESLAGLAEDRYYRGVEERSLGDGLITSTVTVRPQDKRMLTAVGTWQRWSAVIDAEVDVSTGHPMVVRWSVHQRPAG